ncbi:MAG TPA: hypothetical protein VJB96_03040 [Patescibacteria group bacterium]|nr:hypothetical protein [Patescibacteria group bacterium]
MNTQTVSSATVKVNLPSGILAHAEGEAARIGISLQDFIRMLMATYFAQARAIQAVSRVSYGSHAWWATGEAQVDAEIQNKQYTEFATMDDAVEHLKHLP